MNNLILENFSRSAPTYDKYASAQDEAARRLCRYLPEGGALNILETGCGTGIYTSLLCERFPGADIEAMDISSEMVDVARRKLGSKKVKFIVADAESIERPVRFDLITSNAVFNWFVNPGKATARFYNLLKPGGTLLFSSFGPLTFYELNESIRSIAGGDLAITSAAFPDKAGLRAILRKDFKDLKDLKVEEYTFRNEYDSLPELLRSIKYTGTRGNGLPGRFIWKKDLFKKIGLFYKTRHGSILATYQIFFCMGKR